MITFEIGCSGTTNAARLFVGSPTSSVIAKSGVRSEGEAEENWRSSWLRLLEFRALAAHRASEIPASGNM